MPFSGGGSERDILDSRLQRIPATRNHQRSRRCSGCGTCEVGRPVRELKCNWHKRSEEKPHRNLKL
jgi:hypothetical protein